MTQPRTPLTRGVLIVVGLLVAIPLAAFAFDHRSFLLRVAALSLETPHLGATTEEGIEAFWFDDYFTVFRIDHDTYAIGETRYYQSNFNYLILGTSRAVLFDSGPGVRDIGPVVRSLTSLPVTTACSHLHYDHVGHYGAFDSTAMVDLPELRERARDGKLALEDGEHLGYVESFPPPTVSIDEWWRPGSEVDLGGRRIVIHHTPGHTSESIVLEDPERGQFFGGDTFYPGELFVFLPNSSLGDYERSTEAILARMSEDAVIFGAHRLDPVGLPELKRQDLLDLQDAFIRVRAGEDDGNEEEQEFYPTRFGVNERLSLLMDFAWGRRWD